MNNYDQDSRIFNREVRVTLLHAPGATYNCRSVHFKSFLFSLRP
uniref:Uncharacterized protein n=1 Tax=Arundo donax TaxID=35708 RepID=A0A0A9FWT6_ARUDO